MQQHHPFMPWIIDLVHHVPGSSFPWFVSRFNWYFWKQSDDGHREQSHLGPATRQRTRLSARRLVARSSVSQWAPNEQLTQWARDVATASSLANI